MDRTKASIYETNKMEKLTNMITVAGQKAAERFDWTISGAMQGD